MKHLNVIVPAIVTAIFTALAVFSAIWLTRLVPPGEWAQLIKASIVLFIIATALVVIAWSAYFVYILGESLKQ